MKFTNKLKTLRDVLAPPAQKTVQIPTTKFEEISRTTGIQSTALQETQRKLYEMGELIHDVQMSRQFQDCKTFLDRKMKFPFNEVLKNYRNLKLTFGPGKIPPPFVILKFLNENFEEANDLEAWTPPDWKEYPNLVPCGKNDFKELIKGANGLMKRLGRTVSGKVKANKDVYSLIYLNNGFIASSSVLNEMYYWDTYWIIRGLLALDMIQTAKGMLQNLIQLLDTYHYVPRSNRIYHIGQSQIPSLPLMVEAYYQKTNDLQFIKDNIKVLEKEMIFWRNERSMLVTWKNSSYLMYRYTSYSTKPRPQNYREDYKYMVTPNEAQEIISGLTAAEESCWTTSSRWIDANGTNEGTIYDMRTQNVIPVDLNAVIQKDLCVLSKWYKELGEDKKSGQYELQAEELLIAINNVLWDESLGMWCDYNFIGLEPRRYHYISNFTPIWTSSHKLNKSTLSEKVLKYISNNNLFYLGGVPVSLEFSGLHWDFPNVHPTVLGIFLEGLIQLDDTKAYDVAYLLAEMWMDSVRLTYKNNGLIFDVYNALKPGGVEDPKRSRDYYGHGATIGVVLSFFEKWGSQFQIKGEPAKRKTS